jgi:hypothetical protein
MFVLFTNPWFTQKPVQVEGLDPYPTRPVMGNPRVVSRGNQDPAIETPF